MWNNRLLPLSTTVRRYQTIAECYDGKSVLITGSTGFLGKVLLEKLLYSCSGIDKIYLLVREKQGGTAQQRVQKILQQPLFARLKAEKWQALDKIVPIAGDITEPRLGINAEDEELLTDKVSFVFHMAANVSFNEPLEDAMNINVAGTARVLDLSKRMKNIKAYVQVSTAYSNADRIGKVEEYVYPPPAAVDEVKKLLANGVSEDEILGNKPNTYTFTKALAENLVIDTHGNVPAVIVRPSIVSPSKREPLVGWTENGFVATALAKAIMKGRNRLMLGKPDNFFDLIPVDYVSNFCIVAAARCKSSKEVDVYNCCTSGENPLQLKQFLDQIVADSRKHKFYDVAMPWFYMTDSRLKAKLFLLFMQTLPAYIADMFLLISGQKRKHVAIQAILAAARDKTEYFTLNSWVFSAPRARALAQSLSPSDREQYPCDPADIDWEEYIPNAYCNGIREFSSKSKTV